MKWNDREVSANVSLLFTELPYQQRFTAAAAAGFTAVETWWPFTEPDPGDRALVELVDHVQAAGVSLTGLNFFAGDMPGGERGIACRPDRASELHTGTRALLEIARATGCRRFNLLYGQLDETADLDAAHKAAIRAYRDAASAVAEVGGTVLVEPLAAGANGNYPLHTHTDVLHLLDEIDAPGLALLVDTFHLGTNGVHLPTAVAESRGRIGHVQLADVPGRAEPGSGTLDWPALASALDRTGYDSTVAAEYRPTGDTLASLAWLDA